MVVQFNLRKSCKNEPIPGANDEAFMEKVMAINLFSGLEG